MEDFINKWQTLIGSALGPFLAIILSAIGFWLKSVIENKKERKEFLRRIEISVTRSINDAHIVQEQLKLFSKQVKKLAEEADDIKDDKIYFINFINFPTVRVVFRDLDMMNFKIRSYYLHNKLLWIDARIKEMNETVADLKNDFKELIRQNETLIAIMRDNPNPSIQRKTYATNLTSFADAINEYVSKGIEPSVKIMIQIKVYNNQIRKRFGCWFLWKQEGTKFKYFRNKSEQRKFAKNLDSLDRIDKAIQKEVGSSIKEAEERGSKLSQDLIK